MIGQSIGSSFGIIQWEPNHLEPPFSSLSKRRQEAGSTGLNTHRPAKETTAYPTPICPGPFNSGQPGSRGRLSQVVRGPQPRQ